MYWKWYWRCWRLIHGLSWLWACEASYPLSVHTVSRLYLFYLVLTLFLWESVVSPFFGSGCFGCLSSVVFCFAIQIMEFSDDEFFAMSDKEQVYATAAQILTRPNVTQVSDTVNAVYWRYCVAVLETLLQYRPLQRIVPLEQAAKEFGIKFYGKDMSPPRLHMDSKHHSCYLLAEYFITGTYFIPDSCRNDLESPCWYIVIRHQSLVYLLVCEVNMTGWQRNILQNLIKYPLYKKVEVAKMIIELMTKEISYGFDEMFN